MTLLQQIIRELRLRWRTADLLAGRDPVDRLADLATDEDWERIGAEIDNEDQIE